MNLALIGLAIVAHFGLRLTFYNRLNSLGWRRRTIKRIEKIAFVETWLTPIWIAMIWFETLLGIGQETHAFNDLPWWLRIYGGFCLLAGGYFFLLWLLWRPVFRLEHARVNRSTEIHRATRQDAMCFARTSKCRRAACIPGNQMFDLAIEHIDVPIVNLPESLIGYRIAQLSDIHLTGQMQPEYMAGVIERALAWSPEMFALTGDIVDVQECVPWLPELFAPATAPDGNYFILGNHDTRVADPSEVRRKMSAAGWTDLGGRCEVRSLRDQNVLLMGNEWPWFGRPSGREIETATTKISGNVLKICLSHSPDQFDWARRHGIDFLMCGHTHGGQGRLPLIGPILSPSWHGSRWASGDFYREPTLMHVSRGLGGVHLLRIHCRPELSLITLQKQVRK
jgi:predicted MPP superfamily phosphohydrolase